MRGKRGGKIPLEKSTGKNFLQRREFLPAQLLSLSAKSFVSCNPRLAWRMLLQRTDEVARIGALSNGSNGQRSSESASLHFEALEGVSEGNARAGASCRNPERAFCAKDLCLLWHSCRNHYPPAAAFCFLISFSWILS